MLPPDLEGRNYFDHLIGSLLGFMKKDLTKQADPYQRVCRGREVLDLGWRIFISSSTRTRTKQERRAKRKESPSILPRDNGR